MLRFFLDDEIPSPRGMEKLKAHDYGLVVLLYGNIDSFVSAEDRAAASDMLRAWLREDRPLAEKEAALAEIAEPLNRLAGQGAVVDYLGTHLPDPATHRLYFDFGTETLDAGYEPHQRRMDEFLRRAGYVEGRNWVTRKFDGAEHSETAWRQRVDEPLRFLLGPAR